MNKELIDLEDIRQAEELSFRTLAKRVGVSYSVLYKAMRGATEPSEFKAKRMRRFLESRETKGRKRRTS
jgi:ribosome-binding protein aMBF1 (putative translation factor)